MSTELTPITDSPTRKYVKGRWAGEPENVLKKMALERMAQYRIDALDAIHDLATMDIEGNSAQNQVKLMAAKLLAFPEGAPTSGRSEGGLATVLASLNDKYHKDAPRIRSIRERVVTFETTDARVIEGTTGE